MDTENVTDATDEQQTAMVLTDTEWNTLRDIVTVFRANRSYESQARKDLIDRILEATG